MRLASVAATLTLAAAQGSVAFGTPATLTNPYEIYARARSAWASQHYPNYVAYTIHVQVDEGGVSKSNHYHALYDQANGKAHVAPVSDEERAQPPVPSGMTIHLLPKRQNATIVDKRVGRPAEAVDYLGIPMLAPNYSFGLGVASADESDSVDPLVAQIRSEFNDPMPPKQAPPVSDGHLRSIAAVTVIARRYTIQLAGIENIDGADCYHLLLQPAREPRRFRLRALWIDVQSYKTRRLLTANNFMNSQVPWLVSFVDINGASYIASEVAQAPVGVGDHRYQQASISFEDVALASGPASAFDSMFLTSENVLREP